MPYLSEEQIRDRIAKSKTGVLSEQIKSIFQNALMSSFDIFLSHSVKDAEIVYGVRAILEEAGKRVYVDWMDDPTLDRNHVTEKTADTLRTRMKQCNSLFYLYTASSTTSRWMPWELGFFDAFNGNVAILPVKPETGSLDFTKEEYLLLYPKVDFVGLDSRPAMFVNKSLNMEVGNYKRYDDWVVGDDKLRPMAA